MATPAKKAKVTSLPVCPYGARCYRKNPQHLNDFYHPTSDGTSSSDKKPSKKDASSSSTPASLNDSSLPPCKYGAKCYRKNLLHFAEYSHPTSVTSKKSTSDDSGNDTDPVDSDDDKPKAKKKVATGDILKRGMSLVKSYSQMSEEERKELIKKAFEAKQKLQKELQETKDKMKEKDKELQNLQDEVNKGILFVEGEKEALEGTKTVYFTLQAERSYKEGSAAQTHFRLAESQFYRLLSSGYGTAYKVSKVEYVVNPKLVKKFKQGREDIKNERGEDLSYPVLAFHGTKEENITPICENGFKTPGDSGFAHRTDTGWYGKGVYFSEFPDYSMSYIQGAQKLLLCQVLPGKVYKCTKLIHGAALRSGFDSHTSPDGKELIIFNSHHIIPSYVVHYKQQSGDFQYSKTTQKVKGKTKGGAKADDDEDDDAVDDINIAEAFNNAMKKPKSKIFEGITIQFTGAMIVTQKEMMALAEKHGAKKGTPSVFNLLVATPEEFEIHTNKVMKAFNKGVPIVKEIYLYDCINKKQQLDKADYCH